MSQPPVPDFSPSFPAKRLTTHLDWGDLVLPLATLAEVEHIAAWITHSNQLRSDWGFARLVAPGYRALFYGPPGTGKTLTANLLGKYTKRDVYRIDLSMVVSKYIGETEKNLSQIFDVAADKGWILFFDEADALFGKRTSSTTSNDRYANQEVSYLLQRIEDFDGVVILASNMRNNIDEAFARRFQSMINFPRPDAEARLKLWQQMIAGQDRIDPGVDLVRISQEFELNGAEIANVLQRAALSAMRLGQKRILADDLDAAIKHEIHKNGGG